MSGEEGKNFWEKFSPAFPKSELDETWLGESKHYIWGAAGILENLQKICHAASLYYKPKMKQKKSRISAFLIICSYWEQANKKDIGDFFYENFPMSQLNKSED